MGSAGMANELGAVDATLTSMCQRGIYDHLAGGIARYSMDERWLAPYSKKMLYDNAQRIKETIAWTLDELVVARGGFAATLDADRKSGEGRLTSGRKRRLMPHWAPMGPSSRRPMMFLPMATGKAVSS